MSPQVRQNRRNKRAHTHLSIQTKTPEKGVFVLGRGGLIAFMHSACIVTHRPKLALSYGVET
jgi:hypothetical protein